MTCGLSNGYTLDFRLEILSLLQLPQRLVAFFDVMIN